MKTNPKAIARLSSYRDALNRFKTYGSEWVLSEDLAQALSVTAAQVRKDFSIFSVPGKKKLGYKIEVLIKKIDRILDKNAQHPAIIAGVGELGAAILNTRILTQRGVQILAAFDQSPDDARARITDTTLPVFPMEKLSSFITENAVILAVLCTPAASAQKTLDQLVMAGVRGVLNISPCDVKTPRTCVVNTLNLGREFEKVVYFTNPRSDGTRI